MGKLELLSQADYVLNACGRPVPPEGFKFVDLPRIIPFHYTVRETPVAFFPSIIPPSPQGYDIGQSPHSGPFAQHVNGAEYAFLAQSWDQIGTSGGDGKLHAMKSLDGGQTWVEQDALNAPALTISLGYGSAYGVSKPDGNTIFIALIGAVTFGSGTIAGFYVITYNLATDTWGVKSSLYAAPVLKFDTTAGNSLTLMNLLVRGTGDYLFQFNGAFENVGGTNFGRVYVCPFDGTTFGAPVMLPGQAGVASNFTASRAAVDSQKRTQFILQRYGGIFPAPFQGLLHVAMDASNSFGSVTTIVDDTSSPALWPFAIWQDVGDPTIDFVSGVETISFVAATGPGGSPSYSFFSAPVALTIPTWTASLITSNPAIVATPFQNELLNINIASGYVGGKYWVAIMVDLTFEEGPNPDGSLWSTSSSDGGATWSTPTQDFSSPALPDGFPASNQITAYSGPSFVGVVAMYTTATHLNEIALFDPLGSVPPVVAIKEEVEQRSETLFLCQGIMLDTDPVSVRIKWPSGRYWNQQPSQNINASPGAGAAFPQGTGGNLFALDEEMPIERGAKVAIQISGNNLGTVDVHLWGVLRYLLKDTPSGAFADNETCIVGYPAVAQASGAPACLVGYPVPAGARGKAGTITIPDPDQVLKARPRFEAWPNSNIMAPEFLLGNQCDTTTPPGKRDESFTFLSNNGTPYVIASGKQLYSQLIAMPGQNDLVIRRWRAIITWLDEGTGNPLIGLRTPSGYSLTGGDLIPAFLGFWFPVFPTLVSKAGTALIADFAYPSGGGSVQIVLEFDAAKRR